MSDGNTAATPTPAADSGRPAHTHTHTHTRDSKRNTIQRKRKCDQSVTPWRWAREERRVAGHRGAGGADTRDAAGAVRSHRGQLWVRRGELAAVGLACGLGQ